MRIALTKKTCIFISFMSFPSLECFLYVSFAAVSTICFPIRCDMCLSRFFRFTKYLLLTFKFRIFGRGFPRCGELVVLF